MILKVFVQTFDLNLFGFVVCQFVVECLQQTVDFGGDQELDTFGESGRIEVCCYSGVVRRLVGLHGRCIREFHIIRFRGLDVLLVGGTNVI